MAGERSKKRARELKGTGGEEKSPHGRPFVFSFSS